MKKHNYFPFLIYDNHDFILAALSYFFAQPGMTVIRGL